jgi:hypothetical protein
LDKIKNSADILKNNYLTLDPTGFASFPVYINEDEIICFSGLQINSDKWDQCARINARMWIDPHYRHNYLTKMTNPNRFLNTRYLLPIQIKRAQELNIDTVFISREGDYRRFLKRYCDLILLNTGYEFTVLDHRYNVCGNIHTVPDSCCQLVAIHSFSGTINDWNTSMLKYQIL